MAIVEMELDPNAAAYTDDQIVGKVNTATANITRAGSIEGTAASALDTDDIGEGAGNKYDTGAPPATTDALAEGSSNKYDTGVPPTDLADLDSTAADKLGKAIITNPQATEFTVVSIQRKANGKLGTKYDDVAV
ncbi:hypothetical protein LCGC14_1501150 [marine sediment metagenome]|uniref:Uncharacterized protein n=1 Tax=marine sediment metagenome TaxID=412755 RepID=A0A0F9JPX2_9ZZZZ